jgi:hypothetical protein
MAVPGFTAETSLYRSSERCKLNATVDSAIDGSTNPSEGDAAWPVAVVSAWPVAVVSAWPVAGACDRLWRRSWATPPCWCSTSFFPWRRPGPILLCAFKPFHGHVAARPHGWRLLTRSGKIREVQAMGMPGFNAEASLFRTIECHQQHARPEFSNTVVIAPAACKTCCGGCKRIFGRSCAPVCCTNSGACSGRWCSSISFHRACTTVCDGAVPTLSTRWCI